MNAETRIKLTIGTQFVEIQGLQDHVQKLLKENAEKDEKIAALEAKKKK